MVSQRGVEEGELVLLSTAESQEVDVDEYEAVRVTLSHSRLKVVPCQVHKGH